MSEPRIVNTVTELIEIFGDPTPLGTSSRGVGYLSKEAFFRACKEIPKYSMAEWELYQPDWVRVPEPRNNRPITG